MGIVPIWGFQLAIAIAAAFLLKLNKALVILAANISIPPMIPFILFLSYQIGGLWMGEKAQHLSFTSEITFDSVRNNFVQYVFGAFTLAVAAGITFWAVTYVGLKFFRHRKT